MVHSATCVQAKTWGHERYTSSAVDKWHASFLNVLAPGLTLGILAALISGCAVDRATSPLTPGRANRIAAKADSIAQSRPGGQKRTIMARPGPMTQAQVNGRLGTPDKEPGKWRGFEIRRASLSASAFASPFQSSMMQEEARDSLFGALEIVIGGTSGEVSVGSRGTENSGPVASVEGWAYPTLYYGTYLPYEEPAIHCSSNGFWCSNGNYYGVDCEIAGGSRLRANSEHTVVYVSGLTGFGTIQRDKSCGPSGRVKCRRVCRSLLGVRGSHVAGISARA